LYLPSNYTNLEMCEGSEKINNILQAKGYTPLVTQLSQSTPTIY